MTPDRLAAIGEQLHGKRWRAALARHLKLSYAAMRNYARGRRAIPGPVAVAAECLLNEKHLRKELDAHA